MFVVDLKVVIFFLIEAVAKVKVLFEEKIHIEFFGNLLIEGGKKFDSFFPYFPCWDLLSFFFARTERGEIFYTPFLVFIISN